MCVYGLQAAPAGPASSFSGAPTHVDVAAWMSIPRTLVKCEPGSVWMLQVRVCGCVHVRGCVRGGGAALGGAKKCMGEGLRASCCVALCDLGALAHSHNTFPAPSLLALLPRLPCAASVLAQLCQHGVCQLPYHCEQPHWNPAGHVW